MQSHETLTILSVAIVVSMAFVGVGYGLEYSGSSLNSDNSLNVTYMKFKLNDEDTCTFVFDDITYYRDRAVDGTVTYKYTSTESAPMKLWIEGTGAMGVDTTAQVKLAEAQSVADISLKIYSDETCTVMMGEIPLNNTYATIPVDLKTSVGDDSVYWCKINVQLKDVILEGAEDVVAQPSGTLTFDVVFNATAEATA
ncbi:transmembrane protein [methanogenic archaeon ISO4-H5]|nr:transmembrane protein [methanogenic archaeon ISO4-H5]